MSSLEITTIHNSANLPIKAIIKPEFHQTYALAMVDFGSLDSTITNQLNIIPGSAHFLEHKLFAKPNFDSAEAFAKFGANSNAFTSYTKTAYLFQTVGQVANNLGVLLDLISRPYFTEANVLKEQKIIAQEIQMYADNPDWVLEQATLNNLFPHDPITQDIAGTLSSIQEITAANLLTIYQQYYVPSNFQIYLAGAIDQQNLEDQLAEIIAHNRAIQQFAQRTKQPVLRYQPIDYPVKSAQEIVFKAQRPHMMLGLRIIVQASLSEMIVLQNQLELLFGLILGETSSLRQSLLEQHLIDDSFGYSVIVERKYAFILISAETDQPHHLGEVLRTYLLKQEFMAELTAAALKMVKADSIGSYLFASDYMENLATESAELAFYDLSYEQMPPLINQISLEQLQALATTIFQADNMTITYLQPEMN